MNYDEIIAKVADSTGLSKQLVDKTYKSYWRVVKEYVQAVPLADELTDEEFPKARPNVNIPSLGKLYVAIDRYHRLKKRFAIGKER